MQTGRLAFQLLTKREAASDRPSNDRGLVIGAAEHTSSVTTGRMVPTWRANLTESA